MTKSPKHALLARRGGDRTARGVVGDAARANGPMTCQPMATPWVIVIKRIKALKGFGILVQKRGIE